MVGLITLDWLFATCVCGLVYLLFVYVDCFEQDWFVVCYGFASLALGFLLCRVFVLLVLCVCCLLHDFAWFAVLIYFACVFATFLMWVLVIYGFAGFLFG